MILRSVSAISFSLARLSQREIRDRWPESEAKPCRARGRSGGCASRFVQSRYSSGAKRHMDTRVAFAIYASLLADNHEFLCGIARLAKARKEAPGQVRPSRDEVR